MTKKSTVRCYVIGRLVYTVPFGYSSGTFNLAGVFSSRDDATSQGAISHSNEQLVNIFQTETHESYDLALIAAKEMYKKQFPKLHAEFTLVESC